MATTMRSVDTRFWVDTWVRKLNPLDRYVFLYFLTNTHSSWCGVYELDMSMVAFETGIHETDLVNSILPRISSKIIYIDGWVCIKNFEKYHSSKSADTQKGIENAWKVVPEEIRSKIKALLSKTDPLEGGSPSSLTSTSTFASTFNTGESPVDTPQKKAKYGEEDMKMVDLLISLIVKNTPEWVLKGNKETWAEHIEKLHRIDGRTYEQIEYMIRWTQADAFWQQNILSTAKLRDKFNDLIPKLKASVTKEMHKSQIASKPKMI